MKIKSRKHWYSYTGNIFLILFIGVPAIIFYIKSKEMTDLHPSIGIAILIFGIWILYKSLRGIILNWRVEWIFENDVLTVKSGLLPWRRTMFSMDISQIYEAYYSKSFMGTLLGYGGLHIRRTDGVTSRVTQFSMTNHKKIISKINNSLNLYKKNSLPKAEHKDAKKINI